ncbi:MAG TPA: arginine--tRNA ligase [Candidatus Limnocylindria bacterium]|nr:arginine--tRNA ligase [Candidatus Limnocylindria bacterium]
MTVRAELQAAIVAARDRAVAAGELALPPDQALPEPTVQRPAHAEHGDYATNAAMQLAPLARSAPMAIADVLVRHLELPASVGETTVLPPGFINWRLDPAWVAGQVPAILAAGANWGRTDGMAGQRFNVEYISANPTGPLHIGNGRGGFIGDALANLLEATGADVTREYYVNDYGSQVRDFGQSVYLARTGQSGEAGYRGAYIGELAAAVPDEVVASLNPLEAIGEWAWNRAYDDIKKTIARLRMRIDVYRSERELHESGEVTAAIEQLRTAGHVYEDEGATWFRSTTFGDDKDRVLIRSNGQPTYFAADVAYLLDKFERGANRLIYVLGPDHHGTIKRWKGAAAGLGHDPDAVEFIIYQHVSLAGGAAMSKREGSYVTLDELVDEVGADATRFLFTLRSANQHLEFDMDLARQQTNENPVYYVQYAHARCSSILRQPAADALDADPGDATVLLVHPAEQTLIRHLMRLPEAVADSADRRETHELPRYAMEVANLFSQFYRDCRVLTDDVALSTARVGLVRTTRQVLANSLALIGVSAPDTM